MPNLKKSVAKTGKSRKFDTTLLQVPATKKGLYLLRMAANDRLACGAVGRRIAVPATVPTLHLWRSNQVVAL
jgi:hypothetical protein